MSHGLKFVSLAALATAIVPSAIFLAGAMSLDAVQWTALIGTLAWFAVTPLWMGRKLGPDADQVQI